MLNPGRLPVHMTLRCMHPPVCSSPIAGETQIPPVSQEKDFIGYRTKCHEDKVVVGYPQKAMKKRLSLATHKMASRKGRKIMQNYSWLCFRFNPAARFRSRGAARFWNALARTLMSEWHHAMAHVCSCGVCRLWSRCCWGGAAHCHTAHRPGMLWR